MFNCNQGEIMRKDFWTTEVGKRTWVALLTGQISQSEASRVSGAPGQSAISQRLLRYKTKETESIKESPQKMNECPVCGMISNFESLSPQEKIRVKRLLSTERGS